MAAETVANHQVKNDKLTASGQQVSADVVRAKQSAAQAAADKKAAADKARQDKAAADAAAKKKADDERKKKAAAASRSKNRCTAPAHVLDLSSIQTQNARAIIRAGKKLGINKKGQIIALSTALQESGLRNYANGNIPASMGLPHQAVGYDHDSVGLFQQRPIAPWGAGSWGTLNELMTPEKSATKFYQALLRVPGWQGMAVTVAAQTVQVSAFPEAYADDAVHANSIVNALPCP
ncbi:MAG TPA: hypothetical protein VGN37_08485 [Actinocatenispora sp.]